MKTRPAPKETTPEEPKLRALLEYTVADDAKGIWVQPEDAKELTRMPVAILEEKRGFQFRHGIFYDEKDESKVQALKAHWKTLTKKNSLRDNTAAFIKNPKQTLSLRHIDQACGYATHSLSSFKEKEVIGTYSGILRITEEGQPKNYNNDYCAKLGNFKIGTITYSVSIDARERGDETRFLTHEPTADSVKNETFAPGLQNINICSANIGYTPVFLEDGTPVIAQTALTTTEAHVLVGEDYGPSYWQGDRGKPCLFSLGKDNKTLTKLVYSSVTRDYRADATFSYRIAPKDEKSHAPSVANPTIPALQPLTSAAPPPKQKTTSPENKGKAVTLIDTLGFWKTPKATLLQTVSQQPPSRPFSLSYGYLKLD